MPAWITPELCVLESIPNRGWRSSRQTVSAGAAMALAAASPTTPPPITATSTVIMRDISYAAMSGAVRRMERGGGAPATQHVPLLDLKAQYEPIRGELLTAITRVCDS